MTEEIELTQIPCEGLRSYYKTQAQRDIGMRFWQDKGMECQAWKCNWNGIDYWGFSYSHKYHLSKKQKQELERLKK